ncbi:MAG: hypothetical protein K6G60_06410 [Lachnospiraceae bacterium]|nr:hypothetical protein [Lachnospiraceae bacterium]
MSREYKYKGYTFYSEEEYNEARKENETIEYIKSKADLGRTDAVIALYNKLIDRNVISTVVGLDFLKRLRGIALNDQMVDASKLRELPVIEVSRRKKEKEKIRLTKEQIMKRRILGLEILTAGLVIIIIGMFVIVLTGKSSPLKSVYEQDVLDRYSSWQQDLDEKQEWINDRLYFLEQNGIFYDKDGGE